MKRTPTIEINDKAVIVGSYPELKEDIIASLNESATFDRRAIIPQQMENGEVCRIFVDEKNSGDIKTDVRGSPKCKGALKGILE